MNQRKLRSIEACPVHVGGNDLLCLRDAIDGTGRMISVPREALFTQAQFDGKHSSLDIQEVYIRRCGQFTPALLGQVAREHQALLAASTVMDAERCLRSSAEPRDRRRICGVLPTYKLRGTMPAMARTVLNYAHAVEPAAHSMVPYASVVFH
jgi:hypothetical protein